MILPPPSGRPRVVPRSPHSRALAPDTRSPGALASGGGGEDGGKGQEGREKASLGWVGVGRGGSGGKGRGAQSRKLGTSNSEPHRLAPTVQQTSLQY
jgi:hypothetical protein